MATKRGWGGNFFELYLSYFKTLKNTHFVTKLKEGLSSCATKKRIFLCGFSRFPLKIGEVAPKNLIFSGITVSIINKINFPSLTEPNSPIGFLGA